MELQDDIEALIRSVPSDGERRVARCLQTYREATAAALELFRQDGRAEAFRGEEGEARQQLDGRLDSARQDLREGLLVLLGDQGEAGTGGT
jgi:hypothetical protein